MGEVKVNKHPLEGFRFCPKCGSNCFVINNAKSRKCRDCGFVYYFNPSAAVAGFITDGKGNVLVAVRAKDPAKGTLDLPGGFVDADETAEEAMARELCEETSLVAESCRYLFSIPNIYPYSGFEVHTVDIFFECHCADLTGAVADDDVQRLEIMAIRDLDEGSFGLVSIKKAVKRYIDSIYI